MCSVYSIQIMYISYRCYIPTLLLLIFYLNAPYVKAQDNVKNERLADVINSYKWTQIDHKHREVRYLASLSFLNYTKDLNNETNNTNNQVSVISAEQDETKRVYHIQYRGHGCSITEICSVPVDLECETILELVSDVNNPLNIKSTNCNPIKKKRRKRYANLVPNPSANDHHVTFLANFAILKYAAMVDEDPAMLRNIKILSKSEDPYSMTHEISTSAQICYKPLTQVCVQIGHVKCDTIIQERLDIFRPFDILKLSCTHAIGKNWMLSKSEKNETMLRKKFHEFVKKYNKPYLRDRQFEYRYLEYEYRFQVFSDNYKYINHLNKEEMGSAKYGVTQFADIPDFVFKYKYFGLDKPTDRVMTTPNIPNVYPPDNFDWREEGIVTGIKDQQLCGACWAFSAIANIESLWTLRTGKLMRFSEQHLIDCDPMNKGCEGGIMETAYQEIMHMGGVVLDEDYPFTGTTDKCNEDVTPVANITGAFLLSRNEEDIKKYLYAYGPLAAALNGKVAQFYVSGVSWPSYQDCQPYLLGHAMLIVGYGVERWGTYNLPYWILKNSWGQAFGENGYYRLYRGEGTCGINLHVTSARM